MTVEEAADSALEKEVYEKGNGFLSVPYTNYRFHNGFVAGAEWALAKERAKSQKLLETLRKMTALGYEFGSQRIFLQMQEMMKKAIKEYEDQCS